MEKVIRATDRAKTQARRRLLAQRAQVAYERRTKDQKTAAIVSRHVHSDIRTARAAQREDWLLGPLAPRRDVGSLQDTYGTIHANRTRGVREKGDQQDYCIEKGDRVVVVGKEFRDRGKIGKVLSVDVKHNQCKIDDINLADIALPMAHRALYSTTSWVETIELPIPLSAVRLVYPLRNNETGIMRDVIINKLNRSSNSEKMYGGRYVADSDPKIYIPFPEQPKPEVSDCDIDTLRIEVEEKTWTPTLYQAPMPPSVIDELRNKYSVLRDRYDESYVRAREQRAAGFERARIEREKLMVTPRQEYHRLMKLQKSRTEEKTLDQDMLMRIGEVMARNRRPVSETKEASV